MTESKRYKEIVKEFSKATGLPKEQIKAAYAGNKKNLRKTPKDKHALKNITMNLRTYSVVFISVAATSALLTGGFPFISLPLALLCGGGALWANSDCEELDNKVKAKVKKHLEAPKKLKQLPPPDDDFRMS